MSQSTVGLYVSEGERYTNRILRNSLDAKDDDILYKKNILEIVSPLDTDMRD